MSRLCRPPKSVVRCALLFLVLWPAGVPVSAQPDEQTWELRRDQDDIQVYTRPVEESPYDAVKATMIMNDVRLSTLVAVILDVQACPQWADKCVLSRMLETISDTQMLVYTENNLPFPLRNRDVVSRLRWTQDAATGEVRMTSQAETGVLPEERGLIRLDHASVDWTFTPLADGRIRITNTAHIDPGSPLPRWLINSLLVDTPYKTLLGFREQARKPQYADAVVSFVDEPQ